MVTLMERSTGGWAVRLDWDGTAVFVVVRPGFEAREVGVEVDPELALDAFEHPFCYGVELPAEAPRRLVEHEQPELPGADWPGWSVRA